VPARGDHQVDVLHGGDAARAVRGRDAAQLQRRTFCSRRGIGARGRGSPGGFHLELLDLLDPLGRGDPRLQRGEVLAELHDRLHQPEGVEQERDQRGDLEQPGTHPPCPDGEDHDDRQLDSGPRDRPRHGLPPHRAHAVAHRLPGVIEDAGGLPFLGPARLHGPDRSQRGLQHPAEPPDVLLRPFLCLRDPGHQHREQHDDDHHRGDRGGEQHQVEHRHEDERADEHHDPVDEPDDARRDRLTQQHRVGGDPGDELAHRPAGDPRHRGPQEPADHRLAGLQHDLFAQRAEQRPLHDRDHRADDEQGQQRTDRTGERRRGAQGVQDPLGDQGRGQARGGAGQGQHEPEHERAQVRPRVGPDDAQPGRRGGSTHAQ
jgi:hypothetical protein